MATTPLAPPPAPEGLAYFQAEAEGWEPALPGSRCFHGAQQRGRPACGKPGEARHSRRVGSGATWVTWVSYCAEHLHERLHWVQDGRVWRWELRNADGTPVPERGFCKAHGTDRSQCWPAARHPVAIRCTGTQWQALAERASRAGLSRDEGAEQALAAWVAVPDGELQGRLPGPRGRGRDSSRRPQTPRFTDRLRSEAAAKAERLGITFTDAVVMAMEMWEPEPAAPSAEPEAAASDASLAAELEQVRAELEKATGMLAEWYQDAPHVRPAPQPAPAAMAPVFKSHEDEEGRTIWR